MTEITLIAIADTYVIEDYPDTNLGTAVGMYVGSIAPLRRRSLVNFDLTKIPSGVVIQKAVLRILASWGVTINPQTFGTHRVTSTWAEMMVTWNTQPTIDPTPTDTKTPIELGKWYEFDVTSIIQHQYGTPAERFGIMIRGSEDTDHMTGFPTREYGTDMAELVVTYTVAPTWLPMIIIMIVGFVAVIVVILIWYATRRAV